MKKNNRLLLALTLILFLPTLFYAQSHELVVLNTDYLNNTIMNDVNPDQTRKDPLRVYVLSRNTTYYVNGLITNNGFPLVIKSANGSGTRPIILAKQNDLAQYPARMVDMKGNVTLKGLNLKYYDEANDPTGVSGGMGEVMRSTSAGFDMVIDSCLFNDRSQLRTDGACRLIKITNTTMGEMFMIAGSSDWGGGKCIDLRNSSCDSLVIQNCTFVNEQDRIIRHRASTANLNNFIFDHNTIVVAYSYHGSLELGWLGKKAQITNNLFINPFCLGNDTDIVRQAEFDGSGEKDALNYSWKMALVNSVPNDTTQWTVRNNYVATTAQQDAWYASVASAGVTGLPDYLTTHIKSKITNPTTAFIKTAVTMNVIPQISTAVMNRYRQPISEGGAGKTKLKVYADMTLYDSDRKTLAWYMNTLDCKYNTTSVAYTGADGGKPAGALTWWGIAIPTSVEKTDNEIPTTFSLEQNYPNPFNPTTNIVYSVPKESKVTLQVFDVLGRLVTTLVNSNQQAGRYKVDFDASKLSSGMYIYRLTTNEVSFAKKMLLMK